MPFKFNISDNSGKTYKLELETEELLGKALGDKIQGHSLNPELSGYEFEIKGLSDKAGLTSLESVPGIGLKRVLLTYGKAMHKRPRREGKRKRSNPIPRGLRLRKTVRGNTISPDIVQINLKVIKQGTKGLAEIFPDQSQAKQEKETRKMKREKARAEKEKQPEPQTETQEETPSPEENTEETK